MEENSFKTQTAENEHYWELHALTDGRISAKNLKVGQFVQAGFEGFNLIPNEGARKIEIFQPANKRLTLLKGLRFKVAIDAFPPELHGLFLAKVLSVGRSPSFEIPSFAQETHSPTHPAYRHRAEFEADQSIPPLEDGYTATANILVDNYSIFEWIFSPLFIREY